MELVFDERNLLVPGVYDVSMETVKERFGKFQRSDRRMNLFAKLEAYVGGGQESSVQQQRDRRWQFP